MQTRHVTVHTIIVKQISRSTCILVTNSKYKTKHGNKFADTFLTWAKIERDLEFVGNNIGYYHNASPNKVLIDKSYEVQTLIHDFETQLEMREDIYNAFVQAKKDMKKSGEWETLTKEQQTYIKKTIEGREREGMNLD